MKQTVAQLTRKSKAREAQPPAQQHRHCHGRQTRPDGDHRLIQPPPHHKLPSVSLHAICQVSACERSKRPHHGCSWREESHCLRHFPNLHARMLTHPQLSECHVALEGGLEEGGLLTRVTGTPRLIIPSARGAARKVEMATEARGGMRATSAACVRSTWSSSLK